MVRTQDYNTALEAPTPVREGYTFTGWDAEVPTTVPAGDRTFTAQWQINQYTVKFLADGTEVYNAQQDYGSAITAPDAPEKEGYSFTGWTPEVAQTVPASDVTYTAVYAINQYTVRFIIDNDVIYEQEQDYGSVIVVPNVPEREGYTFSGWGEVAETVPAEDVTYVGTYILNPVTIVYHLHESGVGTLLLPFNAEVPEGLQVFTATDVIDNVITLEQQNVIEAGVPLIVIGEGGEYVFTDKPTFMEKQADAGLLTGTTVSTTIDAGYVLQTQNEMTGFYRVEADKPITVPAYRCWLNYNGGAEVIAFKDMLDALQELNAGKVPAEGAYDLQGRKIQEFRTGIYVINGKKVFIKK